MAICGAIITSRTRQTMRWNPPSAGLRTPWIDHPRNYSGWRVLTRPGSRCAGLLSLSYGNGKIFVVPHEIVGGQMQGGVCALPLPAFPTGIMRGRFNPADGQLYTCGLFGWAGDRTQPGGFYRVRMTGKPLFVPAALTGAQAAWPSLSPVRSQRKTPRIPHNTRPGNGRSSGRPTTGLNITTNTRCKSRAPRSPPMAGP